MRHRRDSLTHAPHVQHITGLDVAKKMIHHATEQQQQAGIENVDFHVSAIRDYLESKGPYDAVLGLSILHLLADRQAVLRQVYRLVKPGGLFITSTAASQPGGLAPTLVPLASRLKLLPILRSFRADQLMAEIEDTGLGWGDISSAKDKALLLTRRP